MTRAENKTAAKAVRRPTGVMALLVAIAAALMLAVCAATTPSRALADADEIPSDYHSQYMNEKGLSGHTTADTFGATGYKTYQGGDVLPGFDSITDAASLLMLTFIPVLFVGKFAGRALISIFKPGDEHGNQEMHRFFMTSEERKGGPTGGAKEGSSWYVGMAKDFLRYFGVALAVWVIFQAILMGINLVMGMSDTSMGPSGFVQQFNGATS